MPENLHNKALRAFKNIQNDNWKFVICFLAKIAKDLGCKATIVSSNCKNSPFGLVIHSDHPVEIDEKEIANQFSEFFQADSSQKVEKRPSFWEKLFH